MLIDLVHLKIDVAPDGMRFLLLLSSVDTPPIHVILNGLPEHR